MNGWGNHDRDPCTNSNRYRSLRDRSRCRPDTSGGRQCRSRCDPMGPVDCATVSPFASPSASLIALGAPPNILQNGLWWFGTPNPTPPTQTTVFTFYPLALIPGFLQPFFGWFSAINLEACVLGVTLRIGPYGTVSGSYGSGCA
jgi:hypothetical protein